MPPAWRSRRAAPRTRAAGGGGAHGGGRRPPRDDARQRTDKVHVTLKGTTTAVGECRRAIDQLLKFGMSHVTHGAFSEGFVQVPEARKNLIIGSEGSTIRALEAATRTKIVIPDAPNPFKKPVYVKLMGSADDVAKVKAAIKTLLKYYHCDLAHPGVVHLEMDVPSALYKRIIGTRGANIKSIQGSSKAKVYMPQPDDAVQAVLVVGLPAQVDNAKRQIDKILAAADEPSAADGYDDDDGDEY